MAIRVMHSDEDPSTYEAKPRQTKCVLAGKTLHV